MPEQKVILMPPPWMLPLFAGVVLALGAAIEVLVAYHKEVSEVWLWHVIIWGCAGLILTLPIAYHAYIYRGKAIKEMKDAKKALEEHVEYLMHIADSLPLGTMVIDTKKGITFQNKLHKSWFGDWTEKPCDEFFKGIGCDSAGSDLINQAKEKSTIHLVTAKGKIFDVKVTQFVMPNTMEMVWLLVFSDITEIEEARRKLTEMEATISKTDKLATLGQMAAGVAHEVNTPLTNISLLAELLEKHATSDEEKKKLRVIRSQVDVAAKTVRDLLSYVRGGTSEFDIVDVNSLVDETIWFIAQKRQSTVSVTKMLSSSSPKVYGIRNQIQQVLVNILSNSYDAITENGEIIVNTDIANNEVVISVKDTGKGIAPEDLNKIFQPFFTTKKSGTGLGLTIAKDILERHGGRIEVESKPGEGSVFRVILPAMKEKIP